jgi:hypothetical protein
MPARVLSTTVGFWVTNAPFRRLGVSKGLWATGVVVRSPSLNWLSSGNSTIVEGELMADKLLADNR